MLVHETIFLKLFVEDELIVYFFLSPLGEKVSVFSKLFRRSSSKRRKSKSPAKYSTFSAQFPPIEWSDPGFIHYHSRSTQTLEGRSSSKDSRPQTSAMALNVSNVSSTPLSATSHTSVKVKLLKAVMSTESLLAVPWNPFLAACPEIF